MWIHNVCMGNFDLHGLILCVSEDLISHWWGSTMCAWKLLACMDLFYVCLKASFLRCFEFTIWAWDLLAFMDWFYVSMKVSFVSSFVFTKNAWKLLTFMDWSYVSLKVLFQSCFVFTLCTFIFYEYHVQCLKLWLSYWFIIIKLSILIVKIPKAKVWPNDTNVDAL